ncbi:MAG TPA: preprotein translocase subunit SecG [Pseudomonadales bacterium]
MAQLEQLILIFHALIALLIVALILIQHGKGADAGASFGSGSSQTVFGVQGGGNLLTRWTAILAALFFISSLSLAYFAKQKSLGLDDMLDDIPVAEQVIEASDEIPSAPEVPAAAGDMPASDEVPAQ